MKKHSFFLIEVLIALFIVGTCSFLISSNFFRFFKQDYSRIEKLEYQRLADITFSEIKELLYTNTIPCPHVSSYHEAKKEFLDMPLNINVFNKKPKPVRRSYKIWIPKPGKQDPSGTIYQEAKVRIFLESSYQYDYQLIIKNIQ